MFESLYLDQKAATLSKSSIDEPSTPEPYDRRTLSTGYSDQESTERPPTPPPPLPETGPPTASKSAKVTEQFRFIWFVRIKL